MVEEDRPVGVVVGIGEVTEEQAQDPAPVRFAEEECGFEGIATDEHGIEEDEDDVAKEPDSAASAAVDPSWHVIPEHGPAAGHTAGPSG